VSTKHVGFKILKLSQRTETCDSLYNVNKEC